MKVSIIIPCYKQAHFLSDAIESCLKQTYKDFEIIVVDDGSPDNVCDVVNKYIIAKDKKTSIKLISKLNGGLSSARNVGIKAAKGEFILPLDADDKISEFFLEKTMQLTGQYDIISTWLQTFGNENRSWGSEDLEPTHQNFIQKNHINCCSLVRKSAIIKVGMYDENMKIGYEDWDLWQRMTKIGYKVRILPEYLFYYRKHAVSMFTDAKKRHDEIIDYMKRKNTKTGKLIDIVYVVGNGSQSANNELRYSLRSVERFCSGYRNIYIIGDKPHFVRNVIWHNFKEGHNKVHNILDKIIFACNLPDLSDDFLFMNDDHFFTEYTDISDYPNYYSELNIKEFRNAAYREIIQDTVKIFENFRFFDIHKPIIYNKAKFIEMSQNVPIKDHYLGLLIKSSYGNFHNIKGVKTTDCILRDHYTLKEINQITKGTDVFSIHDTAINQDLINYFDINYPIHSKFEI